MAEDHITTVRSADGSTEHTTIHTDGGSNSGAGGWIFGIIAVILLALGVYYFAGMSGSAENKNNAIAGAAKDVGAAAQNVGDAATDAANELKKQ